MKNFTFKREPKETGLASVGNPHPHVHIKYNKKIVGSIAPPNWMSKDNKWRVRFTVKCTEHPGWKWVTLKAQFDDEQAARDFVKEHHVKMHALNLYERDDD